jgi:iron complex transport system ATP-binding protein
MSNNPQSTDATTESGLEHTQSLRNGDEPAEEESKSETGTRFAGEELVLGYSGTDESVIDGESLVVPPGEVTALVGPNGSGKSTLLKGLADQLTPDDGRVLLDGRDVHTLDTKKLAQKLGLLSQENVSPDSLTVENLATHGRYPHRGFFDSLTDEDWEAIDQAIQLAGIEHLRDREIGSLSGGQKQLAWIAMVLAQDTDVLLLDEPTTFLDLHHQLEVMDIVETLKTDSEVTVVLVLHDINQAARYAEHMLTLKEGAIYARGDPSEIVNEALLADVFEIEATVERTEIGPQVTPHCAVHEDDTTTADLEGDAGN